MIGTVRAALEDQSSAAPSLPIQGARRDDGVMDERGAQGVRTGVCGAFSGSIVLLAAALAMACGPTASDGGAGESAPAQQALFVGSPVCTTCHTQQAERWRGSHHDLAMQEADAASVLGNFDDATFERRGQSTRFTRRGDEYWVQAEGPSGGPEDFRIAYTFGVEPLQQYLIGFPDGRYQALDVAWDSRPRDDGGQRWFHLQPAEQVGPGDPLHWTGVAFTWNTMCADCHSTDFRKNYDVTSNRYASTFEEIDVACEACHGPGSQHAEWADGQAAAAGEPPGAEQPTAPAIVTAAEMGLVVEFPTIADVAWNIDPETGLASRDPAVASRAEVETCGRCHSRRSRLSDDYEFDRPLTDFYRPALLDERLYYADGQILDEVFVYGSFLQSKMYAQGVTCSDCHLPHSLRLNNQGNALCSRCHLATKFDSLEHTRHEPGTPAATCVACHMPATTYMVVDPRSDHSFRVPRPDLSERLGTPDACSGCHVEEGPQWAASAIDEWFGTSRAPHYGETLAAAREGRAGPALLDLAEDFALPGIVRATALTHMVGATDPRALEVIERLLGNGDPLIRLAAVGALEGTDPRSAAPLALRMVRDRNRAVRLEAGRLLAFVAPQNLPPAARAPAQRAVDEYRAAQQVNADRASAWVNLGAVDAAQGNVVAAEQAYRHATELEPYFLAAYINLADLYRSTGREAEGEPVLRRALELEPGSADVRHALGLVLVRLGRQDEALAELGIAADSETAPPRYGYVYAVALQDAGDTGAARDVLRRSLQQYPADRELLFAATTFARDAGDLDAALGYTRRLLDLDPRDQRAAQLRQEIEMLRRIR